MNLSELAWAALRTSGQASVLIVLVLGLQGVLSSRIPATWRYALWLPVVIRLLLPIAPESRLSLFNLFTSTPPSAPHYQVKVRTSSPRLVQEEIREELLPAVQPERISWRPSTLELASGLWLTLATALMLRWILANCRFDRTLAQSQLVRDERICAIFDEARRDLRVTRKVSLVEHSMIRSPALFGAIHPRLLLPTRLGDKFSDLELRHIFLHELAHVKRGDLYTNWLLVAMQSLHWFNPLVWLACRRMRGDREFACDSMALDHANESKPVEFGKTMLKVLETLNTFQPVIGTISVVRNRVELTRRIQMIATYKPARHGSVFWAALLIGICVAGLSNAQTKSERLNSELTEARKKSSGSNVIQKALAQITTPDSTPPVHDEDTKAKDLPRRMLTQRSRLTGAPLISNLLETITLPEFSIPEETPLSEVIKSLSKEVKERDPEKRGVNFLISSQVGQPSVEEYQIKMNRLLKDVSLFDILETIRNEAVAPGEAPAAWQLNYSIEDYAVVFSSSPAPQLYSRTFRLETNSFFKAIHRRLQRPAVQDEVREFFAGVGLEFPKPSGFRKAGSLTPSRPQKAIFFNQTNGVLLVRATLGELDLVSSVVHQTQSSSWIFQVKLTMRVIETKARSKRSAVEIVSDAISSFSNTPSEWKTNATEGSATVMSAIVSDQDSKTLFNSLETRGEYDLITTHEATVPSGSEVAVSIGGNVQSRESKADVRLIPTVLGDSLALSVEIRRADFGHIDPRGNLLSVNAIGHVTRKLLPATKFSGGETLILSVPRALHDGRDMLLLITPQNLGAEAMAKP